ncbi:MULTISPECIES: AMP-binding protein [Nocardioides]|uniref:AMP-binding protein n=1 Tax=Nocardioides vastitatis TaxID=2568655 RepID=A0ABW0ZHN8_9ACTN|nr:AMP-binding protein [Nocardioides sp.]THI96617.1 acyl-CoA synthetase [Nocardioides sp.]
MKFNLATVFETVADTVPDRIALSYEGRDLTYAALDREATQVAHLFAASGIAAGEHVALYLKNCVEHVTGMVGLLKTRAVPINVNYRYTDAELEYLFTNADAVGIVVEETGHQQALARILPDLPDLRTVFVVGEVEPALRSAAIDRGVSMVDFGSWPEHSEERDFEPRTGDEHYILFTGGTTGYPKGVVWTHDDLFHKPLSGGNPYGDAHPDLEALAAAAAAMPPLSFLIAAPLMHGAASYAMFFYFIFGGRLVMLRDFDPERIVDGIAEDGLQSLLIVGDAMGMPLVEEMERRKDEVDYSPVFMVSSGGAIWSQACRDRFRAIVPNAILRDNFGASESGNDGEITLDGNGNLRVPATDRMLVVDDTLAELPRGPEHVGLIARLGPVPQGYYKDEEKTARTFRTLPDGRRCSVLGDMGYRDLDGSIVFLGRGSQCINTGGEKVYVEEVENVLHGHPDVADVLVVAVPDERLGERVAAVIAARDGRAPSLDDIQSHARGALAGYKVPRDVVLVPEVRRTPAGKADYKWAKQVAAERVTPRR